MHALQLAGAVAGAVIVFATGRSLVQVVVVPRGYLGTLVRLADKSVDTLFRLATSPAHSYERRDRLLSAQGPAVLMTLLAYWLGAFLVGYGLLLWPTVGNLGSSMREAGSSMFTLGFLSHSGAWPTFLDFAAAATGLIVVALQIAYLPTLYAAFNRRETEVTMLSVRASDPAWGPELLARTWLTDGGEDLPELYTVWQRWCADVTESHRSYPTLMRFRSPEPYSSWVISLLAVLDSAALYTSLAPGRSPLAARLCLRLGYTCFRKVAEIVGISVDHDPRPDGGIRLTYEEFAAGVERLQEVGFPLERSAEEAWPHFQGWRVNYEQPAYLLAYGLDIVPARWTGPRRRGEAPIIRPIQANRTPDDPDGREPTLFRPGT
jgi:hypothetical protein